MSPEGNPALRAYRQVKVDSMSPGELILATYDVAIRACKEKNPKLASEAVAELMSGLDFTYEEVAGNLVVMYDWIYRQIKQGELDDAARFLEELRETWSKALEAAEQTAQAAAQGADSTA